MTFFYLKKNGNKRLLHNHADMQEKKNSNKRNFREMSLKMIFFVKKI